MRTGNALISEVIIVGQAYLPIELYFGEHRAEYWSTKIGYVSSRMVVTRPCLTGTLHQNTATCSVGFQGAQQSPAKETSSCLEADTRIMEVQPFRDGVYLSQAGREPSQVFSPPALSQTMRNLKLIERMTNSLLHGLNFQREGDSLFPSRSQGRSVWISKHDDVDNVII